MTNESEQEAGGRAGANPPGSRVASGRSPTPGGKGVRIARRTKRPARAAPGATTAARLLTEAQVTDGLRLDAEDLAVLKRCCSLRPPRNAAAIVSAIKARLEYSQRKPKTEVEHSGGIEVTRIERVIVDPKP